MKNLPGFATYSFVLVLALASLGAVVYGIQSRANELIYYKELNKQRTAGFDKLILCGGPNKLACDSGYSCVIKKETKDAFGKCEI